MPARARRALVAAAVCAVALLVEGLLAFEWPLARMHDAKSLAGFSSLAFNGRIDTAAGWIAHAATPVPYVLFGAAFVVVAMARGLPRLALAVPLAMGAASATTELLKQVGEVRYTALSPYPQISAPSWPSGHATASMMVAVGAVLVAPPLLRPLAALLGGALAVAVSYSVLILVRHYPSDVLGGFLVAGTWTSLTLAALWWDEQRQAPSRRVADGAIGVRATVATAALAVGGLAVAIALSQIVHTHLQDNGSLIVGACAIAIVATCLMVVLVLALRPPRARQATGSTRRAPAQASSSVRR